MGVVQFQFNWQQYSGGVASLVTAVGEELREENSELNSYKTGRAGPVLIHDR